LFCLATLGCLWAPDVFTFLVFRMLQDVIATGLVLSRAVVRDLYPQDEAASRLGYVTMGMAVVPMLGPVFGGYMGQTFGWQSNFWILLGTGLVILGLAWSDAGETRQNTGRSLRQQLAEYPELLTAPRFWGYSLSSAFASGAFFSYLGGAPYVATEIYGLNAAELGRFFGAPAVGYFAGNYISGRYSARFGVNKMILWGCWTVTVGMALLMAAYLLGFGGVYVFFGLMTFVGVGNGLTIPNATAGMLSVRPSLAGSASGLGGTLMLGGGASLSALAGVLLTPGSGAWPLLWLMLTTSVLSLFAIYFVIWRAKQISGLDAG
jgi:DHA1 family bicyclomycin/chloramphenicol resistance-like MFS transporter